LLVEPEGILHDAEVEVGDPVDETGRLRFFTVRTGLVLDAVHMDSLVHGMLEGAGMVRGDHVHFQALLHEFSRDSAHGTSQTANQTRRIFPGEHEYFQFLHRGSMIASAIKSGRLRLTKRSELEDQPVSSPWINRKEGATKTNSRHALLEVVQV